MLITLLNLKQKVACLGESLYVTLAQFYLFIYFLEKNDTALCRKLKRNNFTQQKIRALHYYVSLNERMAIKSLYPGILHTPSGASCPTIPKCSLLVLCFAKYRYIATLTQRGLRLLSVLVN